MPFIFRGCQGWFQHLKERRIKNICISLPLCLPAHSALSFSPPRSLLTSPPVGLRVGEGMPERDVSGCSGHPLGWGMAPVRGKGVTEGHGGPVGQGVGLGSQGRPGLLFWGVLAAICGALVGLPRPRELHQLLLVSAGEVYNVGAARGARTPRGNTLPAQIENQGLQTRLAWLRSTLARPGQGWRLTGYHAGCQAPCSTRDGDAGCWMLAQRWTPGRGLGKEIFAIRRTSDPMQAMRLPSTVTVARVFSLTFSSSPWYLSRGPEKCLHCTAG